MFKLSTRWIQSSLSKRRQYTALRVNIFDASRIRLRTGISMSFWQLIMRVLTQVHRDLHASAVARNSISTLRKLQPELDDRNGIFEVWSRKSNGKPLSEENGEGL
jgi:hypothetical protein